MNSATSGDSAAAPDIQKRMFPPKRALTLDQTNLSYSLSKTPFAGTASHSTSAFAILLAADFFALPIRNFFTPVAASN